MSSTGRGGERKTDDTYFTRYPCALAICEQLRDDGVFLLPEHAENATRIISGDFLRYETDKPYDAIIGNPPYSEAEAHVRHAITLLKQESHAAVCFLLRLNFLAGIERNGWSKKDNRYTGDGFYDIHKPEYVYVLDKRPPFIDDAKGKNRTDSCEYGVFVWRSHTPDFEPTIRFIRWRGHLEQWEMSAEKIARSQSGSAKPAAGESSPTAPSPDVHA
jgi:hypothetical protein